MAIVFPLNARLDSVAEGPAVLLQQLARRHGVQSLFRGKEMGSSTGPRTARGKSRSSQNAAKHWIGSGRILPEEQKEAAFLRSRFAEDFKPEGSIENEVIDDLTFNRLIKRRIDIAYTREFSKAAVEKTMKFTDDDERSAMQYWLRSGYTGMRYWPGVKCSERLIPHICVPALEVLKKRINERGPQSQGFVYATTLLWRPTHGTCGLVKL
ncbi:MAG: hypothetical protein WCA38_11200 [Candidatus Acidiferrales bacterium]